ncbi:MAG: NAD(P)(+) transhydrogenase (Re/Si-specific) subunit beta [Candidatus Eisenbacteria bacterium]|nr:NAD(P)(+) transhydrogenase (Re/Si-specific) subunit beta [Candidatus Eisenbacteria bacterium]
MVFSSTAVNLIYLLSSILFVYALKGLSHPRTAVRGNQLGALGMLLAIIATLLSAKLSLEVIFAGLLVGSVAGAFMAIRVPMTGMPQMVALLNGFGGAASLLVGGAVLIEVQHTSQEMELSGLVATALSGLIGAVTFWGSLVAYLQLQEVVLKGKPILFPGRHALNVALVLGSVVLGAMLVMNPEQTNTYWLLVAAASLLGVLLVTPIGGADMPVVICLLNSYSGLAGAATGFVLNNTMLIIAGSLVGASGIILTQIMCKAMNRSLANVLFGGVGAVAIDKNAQEKIYAGKIKSVSADELAMLLDGVRRVVIVPGYGLAVAQAQHATRDLMHLLEARGVEVLFGIHPVAGRMPGHMNVLLAEADVPYDKMIEMDEINPLFDQTDVVIINGANDVVNPLARTDPKSPIAGMPILDVDKAKTVIMIKRSLSPGFAGVPNPLFAMDNCLMFFGDGRKVTLELIASLKEAAA